MFDEKVRQARSRGRRGRGDLGAARLRGRRRGHAPDAGRLRRVLRRRAGARRIRRRRRSAGGGGGSRAPAAAPKRRDTAGTVSYWAHEVVLRERVGAPADMWALGCVLYILLCGCHPLDPTATRTDAQLPSLIAKADIDRSNKSLVLSTSSRLTTHLTTNVLPNVLTNYLPS